MTLKSLSLILMATALSACSTMTTMQNIGRNSAEAPLEMLNLIRDDIPAEYRDVKNPYYDNDSHTYMNCDSIAAELDEITEFLGPDLDAKPLKLRPRIEILAEIVTLSFIPYKGVIRFVTGSRRHADKVENVRLVTQSRRGYLKGVGESMGCHYPARPRHSFRNI